MPHSGPTYHEIMSEVQCSEITDPCEYNEHHKCSGRMHEDRGNEHVCACGCHNYGVRRKLK